MPTLKSEQQKLKAVVEKAERARDAVQAVEDYEADKHAVHVNMIRLRALRLAKERDDTREATARPR